MNFQNNHNMRKLISVIPYHQHVANVIKYYFHIILFRKHFDFHYKTDYNN